MNKTIRLECDFFVLAVIWSIGTKETEEHFKKKKPEIKSLLASIYSFVSFWLQNISNKK